MLTWMLLLSLAVLVRGWQFSERNVLRTTWRTLRSNAGADSVLDIPFGVTRLPVKVKVQVRPLDGPNAGFSFEAIGSAQWDDDVNVRYCGVVYVYNETHVRIAAPTSSNVNSHGSIFCAGQPGWSGNENAQAVDEAEVRAVIYFEDAFPIPSVEIDWTPIDCTDPDKVYFEFPAPPGVGLTYLTVQVRVQDSDCVTWISEAIGTDNSPDPIGFTQLGGVIYSHDLHTIRVYVRRISAAAPAGANSVVNIEDGWSFAQLPTQTRIQARTGDIRILGWKNHNFGTQVFIDQQVAFDLDSSTTLPTPRYFGDVAWKPDSIVIVQVILTDGPNEGQTFYANGVMPREAYNGVPYGGLQFGYTDEEIRIFFPTGPDGCAVRIGPTAGNGDREQCARKGLVYVSVWNLPTLCTC